MAHWFGEMYVYVQGQGRKGVPGLSGQEREEKMKPEDWRLLAGTCLFLMLLMVIALYA
jgi:hypothetical protein